MSSMNPAETIMSLDASIRNGTLRMFGAWFGRPMDNIHKVISAEYSDPILKISFSGGETLEIIEPSNILVEGTTLKILKAKNVKWSWFYYGRPKTENNLLTIEYSVQKGMVKMNTKIGLPVNASISKPAVEIC